MIESNTGNQYETYVFPILHEGMRVRLQRPGWGLTLKSDTGTVVRPTDDDGYDVIRLDAPALYDHGAGQVEELTEVVEASDNVTVLAE